LTGILLMTPPAYQRVGEMTPHFLHFASKVRVCAMLPLALVRNDITVDGK
jgi:hypothetical protein